MLLIVDCKAYRCSTEFPNLLQMRSLHTLLLNVYCKFNLNKS